MRFYVVCAMMEDLLRPIGFNLRPCWVGCPCQRDLWLWPDRKMGSTIHPDAAVIVAANIVSWWQARGFSCVALWSRKPLPAARGEPIAMRARVVRAVAHALRRGERYTVAEVVGSSFRLKGEDRVKGGVQSNSATGGCA